MFVLQFDNLVDNVSILIVTVYEPVLYCCVCCSGIY